MEEKIMAEHDPHDFSFDLPRFGGRRSLRHHIAAALRAALVAGKMRPDVVYSAPALAEEFNVSATPVREAMLDLVNEGLIEPVPNKGFRAITLSDQDLDNITELRMMIEVPAIADIAAHSDDETRAGAEALRGVAKEIETHAEAGDLIQYVEADRQFHLTLLELTGNAYIVDVIANLRARSRLYGLQGLADRGELSRSAREHEQIVDLVLAGDTDGASALMRQHINHVRGSWAGRQENESTGNG